MRMNKVPGFATFAVLILAACSTPQSDWQEARQRDTVSSYDRFLTDHPKSEFAPEASQRLKAKEAQLDYLRAVRDNRQLSFEAVVRDHPGTDEARMAEEKLAQIAFDRTAKANRVFDWRVFLRKYPSSALAADAQSRLEKLERTLAERAAADAARRKELAQRLPIDPCTSGTWETDTPSVVDGMFQSIGRGSTVIANGSDLTLLVSEVVTQVSPTSIQVSVAGMPLAFDITPATVVCARTSRIPVSALTIGTPVSITSKCEKGASRALSVRAYLTVTRWSIEGAITPTEYDCSHLPLTSAPTSVPAPKRKAK